VQTRCKRYANEMGGKGEKRRKRDQKEVETRCKRRCKRGERAHRASPPAGESGPVLEGSAGGARGWAFAQLRIARLQQDVGATARDMTKPCSRMAACQGPKSLYIIVYYIYYILLPGAQEPRRARPCKTKGAGNALFQEGNEAPPVRATTGQISPTIDRWSTNRRLVASLAAGSGSAGEAGLREELEDLEEPAQLEQPAVTLP
jgi:hypothetical protein